MSAHLSCMQLCGVCLRCTALTLLLFGNKLKCVASRSAHSVQQQRVPLGLQSKRSPHTLRGYNDRMATTDASNELEWLGRRLFVSTSVRAGIGSGFVTSQRSGNGITDVEMSLLIPAQERNQVYVPVCLSAALMEYNSESRQTVTLNETVINHNFMPGYQQSSLVMKFQVLLPRIC